MKNDVPSRTAELVCFMRAGDAKEPKSHRIGDDPYAHLFLSPLAKAALHTSLLDVGGLASRSGVPKLALVRMRPPPFFTIQVTSLVGKTYDGKVIIPDDGEEIEP